MHPGGADAEGPALLWPIDAASVEVGTQAALTEARQALAASSGDEPTRVAEAYEQALVGYLTDNGMPGREAARIAQRVRTEAGIELRLSPKADPA